MTNAALMKRLPPIDVLRPGHAHEIIVNLARIVSGLRWISDGPSSFECLSTVSAFAGAIVRAREKAEKTLEANGADGISNIEGKVARVATSELGNERVSMELMGSAAWKVKSRG